MSIKKRGDTLIEVMMSIAIFAVLAILTINLMNSGLNSAQRTLEELMARNEIDSQAEALRYIHQSYVAERQLDKSASNFRTLWDELRAIAQSPRKLEDDETGARVAFDINKLNSCSEAYEGDLSMVRGYKAFVLNTRLILPDSETTYDGNSYQTVLKDIIVGVSSIDDNDPNASSRLRDAVVYPRIVYKKSSEEGIGRQIKDETSQGVNGNNTTGSLAEKEIYNLVDHAEGVFVIVVGDNDDKPQRSNYYDFYIRTCWHSVGSISPSTITTIVRLYNPEVIE